MVTTTTTDPAVVFGVILATAGTWLLICLLIKHLVDEHHPYTPALPRPATPMLPTALADRHPHALTAACDETQPIATVQAGRARHRKEA